VRLGTSAPGTNMSIRWAADLTTQIVSGALDVTPTIDDWRRGRILTAGGTLQQRNQGQPEPGGRYLRRLARGDVAPHREQLGDPDLPRHRGHDPQAVHAHARPAVPRRCARRQTAYNQPSYPSFYLGADTDWSLVPVPHFRAPVCH
jgi:hypothetical protein